MSIKLSNKIINLNVPEASETKSGLISISAQDFSGVKGFINGIKTDSISEYTADNGISINSQLGLGQVALSLTKLAIYCGDTYTGIRIRAGAGTGTTPIFLASNSANDVDYFNIRYDGNVFCYKDLYVSQNVGIGNTNPSYPLDVESSTAVNVAMIA